MSEIKTIIHSNGGGSVEPIEALFARLTTATLSPMFEEYGNFVEVEHHSMCDHTECQIFGCRARFFGNFYDYSHVFQIDTNDPDLIGQLTVAIRANQGTDAYAQAKVELAAGKAERERDFRHKASSNPGEYYNDIPRSIANAAHAGTSFTPEKRGEQECESYARTLAGDYEALSKHAKTPEKVATLLAEFARYRAGFREKTIAHLTAKSRCMSTMITGGSNFPTARNNKRNAAEGKRVDEVIGYRERALAAIRKALTPELAPIMAGDSDAVERLRDKIAKAEKFQDGAKKVNAAIRKHAKAGVGAQVAALMELGYSEATAMSALKPDVMGNLGIPTYELTNNNANIKRLKQRLESISAAKVAEVETVDGDKAKLEDSPADNRVRLFYPGKPDAETRGRLKGAGFRWTPSLGCWQAYRNTKTLEVARREAGDSCDTCKGTGGVYTSGQVTVECDACGDAT